MFKNKQKLIAGAVLVSGLLSDNCLAANKSISGQLQLNQSELKYSITLEKQASRMAAILKILCSFSGLTSPGTISVTMEDKPWMGKPVLCERFLTQVAEKAKSAEVLLKLPIYLEELSNKMDKIDQEEEIPQLKASIEALARTLAFIETPQTPFGTENLPEANKVMLLDLTTRLTEKGMQTFSALRDNLKKHIQSTDILTFDEAADTINRGFQSGQDYKGYTQIDGAKKLAHFVHCFVVAKGYEMQKIDPPISMKNLQILIRRIVDCSEPDSQLSVLAQGLEEIVCQH